METTKISPIASLPLNKVKVKKNYGAEGMSDESNFEFCSFGEERTNEKQSYENRQYYKTICFEIFTKLGIFLRGVLIKFVFQ